MKTSKTLLILAVVLLGFAAPSFAQLTAIANISINVQSPTSIIKNTDLNFGNIYTPTSAGTVKVLPQETPNSTASSSVTLSAGTGQSAKFTILADKATSVNLSLPNNSPISLFNGIDYMDVILDFSDIKSSVVGGPPVTSGSTVNIAIDKSGAYVFYVGGTLYLLPFQAWGSYTNVTDMEFIVNQ